ncbi:hypothetical protein SCLCIDRAFT_1212596 [Scleroderma citrinum Foug A]|uniref:Uncharacterized protein n=1 Tax=Scleroderma citrinum Foug A TaxID=1036808 RepID=A0A0C3EAY8_9AGAM|nr:hypothetical protein SCLCIDRAFT_1212596 [Scleroderma citrinum Foug A]
MRVCACLARVVTRWSQDQSIEGPSSSWCRPLSLSFSPHLLAPVLRLPAPSVPVIPVVRLFFYATQSVVLASQPHTTATTCSPFSSQNGF